MLATLEVLLWNKTQVAKLPEINTKQTVQVNMLTDCVVSSSTGEHNIKSLKLQSVHSNKYV